MNVMPYESVVKWRQYDLGAKAEYRPARVRHSASCGRDLEATCEQCLCYLDQFPISRQAFEGKRLNRRLRRLPPPLAEELVEQIACEMLERPELFGPVIERVLDLQRNRS